MASNIDVTKPTNGNASTGDVRANFFAAKNEIEALQAKGSVFTGNTAILFGDSFSARNNSAGTARESDWGYFTWANNFLNHPFHVIRNSGISGNTTTQMLSRITADVLAFSPNWVFFQGGINDFFAGSTAESVVSNNQNIINQINATGAVVVYLSIAPNATNSQKVLQANKLMREWITRQNKPNVVYVDTFSALVNPLDSSGAYISGMSDDALHLSPKGARVYGYTIANTIKNLIVSSNALVSSSADSVLIDSSNKQLLQNPLITGTSGAISGTGASGTTATNWTGGTESGTITNVWLANQTRTDGFGADQQVTVSSAGSTSSINFSQSNIQARFTIGDVVYFSGTISATGMTDVREIAAILQFTIDGSTVINSSFESNGSSFTYDQSNLNITFQTPDITLTGNTISAALAKIKVGFGTSGSGAGVFKFGRLAVYKR